MQVQEAWRVRVDDRVYVADLDELIEWVKEGAVAADDLVQKGNLRWLSARKVPELSVHYYKPTIPVMDDPLAQLERNGQLAIEPVEVVEVAVTTENLTAATTEQTTQKRCVNHPTVSTAVVCEICRTSFCSSCPHRFGSVRLCPRCGGICNSYEEALNGVAARGALNKPYARKTVDAADQVNVTGKRLGLRDLLRSLAYPFSNPADLAVSSLIVACGVGGLALFPLGRVSTALGVLVCTILLLAFGFDRTSLIHSNIKNGFRSVRPLWRRERSLTEGSLLRRLAQGFSVYAVSFGLFTALLVTAGFLAWSRYANDAAMTASAVQKARTSITDELRGAYANLGNKNFAAVTLAARQGVATPAAEQSFLSTDIPVERIVMSFMRLSVYYLVPIFLLLVAGVICLPSAFATALQTRSARKTLNPLNSLSNLRQMGFDYVLLVFALLCFIVSFALAAWGLYISLPNYLPTAYAVPTAILTLGFFSALCVTAFCYLLAVTISRRIEEQV